MVICAQHDGAMPLLAVSQMAHLSSQCVAQRIAFLQMMAARPRGVLHGARIGSDGRMRANGIFAGIIIHVQHPLQCVLYKLS